LIYISAKKYPIVYKDTIVQLPDSTHLPANKPCVNILDIGCGYGGLLFNMSPFLQEGDLALGMEIRDKVSNYVMDRINSIRINSEGDGASNISVIRTNAMKVILNYFKKGQIERMFFCFADPHFKKYNHRRRIINRYLLQDYAYLLKENGILYSITDVEDLHLWHLEAINAFPCFKRIDNEELEKDKYLEFMKNTDEARKVMRNKGKTYYAAWIRVFPKITSFNQILEQVKN
jgi:tRNA (guanine-N7-)-methyltransferase